MMKKFIILFLSISSVVFGQSDDHHRKYWYYRTRLNNDFVKVGTGQGESLPFNQRGLGFNGDNNNKNYTTMQVGDASSTLGYYMGVLATEYALLAHNGQNTDKVKHELFCALNAFNRLDFSAEWLFRSPHANAAGDVNGFFIRDDIPQDFVANNYNHFNYYNSSSNSNGEALDGNYNTISSSPTTGDPRNYSNNPVNFMYSDHGFCSRIPNGMFITKSDYASWFNNHPNGNINMEMSQDQIYDLLVGLALTAKFAYGAADGSNIFGGSYQGNLGREAMNILDRIVKYVRNSDGFSYLSHWSIYNNVTGGLTSCCDQSNPKHDGARMEYYSYPLSQAACFVVDPPATEITSGEFVIIPVSGSYPNKCHNYDDGAGENINVNFYLWDALKLANGGGTMDQQVFYNNLGAVCNCIFSARTAINPVWQAIIDVLNSIEGTICAVLGCPAWLTDALNYANAYLYGNYEDNVTASKLHDNAISDNLSGTTGIGYGPGSHLLHSPYLHAVLHNILYPADQLDGTMKSVLDNAPSCGVYNFSTNGNSNYANLDWSSDNRCDHTNRLGSSTASNDGWGGEENGIDYMLYHNLYYLFNEIQGIQPYHTVDLSDRFIEFPLPVSNINTTLGDYSIPTIASSSNVGSHSQPATVGAFETIVADNDVTNTADITYRAGKNIHLINSGSHHFHVANGATFHAFVQPYDCNSQYAQRSANNDNDTSSKSSSYTETDMYTFETHGTGRTQWPVSTKQPPATLQSSAADNSTKADSMMAMVNKIAKDFDLLSKIEVSPNPNNGKFKLNASLSLFKYNITDVMGNFIESGQLKNKETEFDLSRLQPGVYFINLDNGAGYKKTKKIIIN